MSQGFTNSGVTIIGINGPQGDTGFQGVDGTIGFQGVTGSTGTQGVVGPQGVSAFTSGTATLNFGAVTASRDSTASVFVSDTSIQTTSYLRACLNVVATSDHSIDEITVDPPTIFAGNVVVGVGFTIYGFSPKGIAYGQYSVQWAWY